MNPQVYLYSAQSGMEPDKVRLCKGLQDESNVIILRCRGVVAEPSLNPSNPEKLADKPLLSWAGWAAKLRESKADTRVFVQAVTGLVTPIQRAGLLDAIKETSTNRQVFWVLEVPFGSPLGTGTKNDWLKLGQLPDCKQLPPSPPMVNEELSSLEPVTGIPNLPKEDSNKKTKEPHLGVTPVPTLLTPDRIHILHLSDLHLVEQRKANQYYSQLALDLRGDGLNIQQLDYLVVSGDIADKSTEAEYRVALSFFEKLVKGFGLRRDHIILVPGNHDFNWELSEDAYDRFISNSRLTSPLPDNHIREANGIRVRDHAKWLKRFDYFQDFYRSLCGTSYPLEHDQQGVIYKFSDDKLVFLGLNSAWSLGHKANNKVIGDPSINPVTLGSLHELLLEQYKGWLKIAVWHHPIQGKETMNVAFVEQLCRAGFQICMSGHIHEAITGFHHYDEVRKMIEIGAGTFGAITHQVPGIPFQYNVLKLDRDTCMLRVMTRKREHEDGAWEADARWKDRDKDPEWHYDRKVTWGRCKTVSTAYSASPPPASESARGNKNITLPPQVGAQWDTEVIRELLTAALDDEKLTNLCYDKFRQVHEDFAVGMGKGQKIQRLLDHCVKQGQVEALLQAVREKNLYQYDLYKDRLRK